MEYTAEQNHDSFRTISADMYQMLTAILDAAPPLDAEEDGLHLFAAAASIRDSLIRISYYEQHFPEKAVHKIEYELIPLTEVMLNSIYYWGCVYPSIRISPATPPRRSSIPSKTVATQKAFTPRVLSSLAIKTAPCP